MILFKKICVVIFLTSSDNINNNSNNKIVGTKNRFKLKFSPL